MLSQTVSEAAIVVTNIINFFQAVSDIIFQYSFFHAVSDIIFQYSFFSRY